VPPQVEWLVLETTDLCLGIDDLLPVLGSVGHFTIFTYECDNNQQVTRCDVNGKSMWCPVYRWRDSGLGLGTELENSSCNAKGKTL
jgi:hypothetical protein